MEGVKPKPQNVALILTILSYILVGLVKGQIGQIKTPCTGSMMYGFTPCMDFITGSTANGSAPTSNCCDAFKSLMSTSIDCGCMLVTASIPLPLGYIKRNLALSLPRLCGTDDVSVQCQAGGSPLPAPASKAAALTPAADKPTANQQSEASPPVEVDAPSASSNVHPARSASSPSIIFSQSLWLILSGFSLFKLF